MNFTKPKPIEYGKMKSIVLSVLLLVLLQTVESQVSYTWNGSVSSNWNSASNWTPAGIPGPADNVTVVTASNTCVLVTDKTINNFTLSSGTIDLGSHTLTINGTSSTFSNGTVQNGTATVSGATTTSFGAGTVTMNCTVNIISASIAMRNTTFQSGVTLTKTGSGNDVCYGGNVFNGTTVVTNAGSGYLLLANSTGDQFNADVTFNNTGSSNLFVAYNGTGNVFNGVTTFNSATSTNNSIYISRFAMGTTFNNNIIVNSTSGGGVLFCGGNSLSTAILSAGFTISVGASGFTSGTLALRQFSQSGSTPVNISASGTAQIDLGPNSNFDGALTVTAPNIYPSYSVFNNMVTLTKTDGVNSNPASGGNTYNSTLTVNYFATIGSGYWSFAQGAPDIYNGDVYSNNNSLNRIIFGHNSTGNQFNGNFYVSQTGASLGTAMTWNAGSGCTMAAGKTIFIGSSGFNTGFFYIQGLTQSGTAPINLTTTGTSSVYIGAGSANNPSVIGGVFTVVAPDVYVRGGTFNNPVTITKTGGGSNHDNGYQNIFNSTCTINQQSNTGYLMLGYNSHELFNGDIILSSTGAGGIYLGWGSGTPTLAAGKTILTGAPGFSAGFLTLNTFTQLGNAPINLTLTGSNTSLTFADNSFIGGNLVVNSPNLYFSGCTFNGTVDAVKTGASDNAGLGGNIFNGISSFTNNGDGYLMFGNTVADIWNADVSFINTGTDRILPCWNTPGNQFNGNIIVSNTGAATGIQFCSAPTSNATLAAGKTISVGMAGFDAGYLNLTRFTQLGTSAINLPLTGTSSLTFGPSSAIGGNLTSASASLYFNGCTFSGNVSSIKNGSTNNASSGNNIFNGNVVMTNAGSGYLMFGNGNGDQFNATATFNNTGTGNVYVAYNSSNNIFGGVTTFNNTPSANTGIFVSYYSTGTVFTGNIIVNSTNGQGVQFCAGNTTASVTLASGKTISVGATGFSAGILLLKQFSQTGTSAQNINLTGTGNLTFGPNSSFGGNITSTSPSLIFNGTVFNGSVNSTKSGSTNDQSQGGNTFNGAATFTNNGTGYLMMTRTNPDSFNDNVDFIQNSTGIFYPNYGQSASYSGNLNISSPATMTFGASTGTAIFNGTGGQNISVVSGTPIPVFTRMTIDNTGGGVTLNNTSVNVSSALTLTTGLLNTSATHILTMLNNSTVAAGTALSTSYVNGPMRYQKSSSGSSTLNFPVGKGGDCRPIELTVAHSSGALYTYQAELFNASAAALGYTLPATVTSVSVVHYYTIGRTDASNNNQPVAGLSGNQTIKIHFGTNDLVTDGNAITIVKNTYATPNAWIDVGGAGGPAYSGGIYLTGSIASTSSPTAFNSFSNFAIGFRKMVILPVTTLDFTALVNQNNIDLQWMTTSEFNNRFFTVEKSKDGVHFEAIQNISTRAPGGYSQVILKYATQDNSPYTGISYYRLKQTDTDGKFSYSKIVTVSFLGVQQVSVYPNPTTGIIYIKGLSANTTQIECYDAGGKVVATGLATVQNRMAKINFNVTNGIYILKYTTDKGNWQAQRIIIRK